MKVKQIIQWKLKLTLLNLFAYQTKKLTWLNNLKLNKSNKNLKLTWFNKSNESNRNLKLTWLNKSNESNRNIKLTWLTKPDWPDSLKLTDLTH